MFLITPLFNKVATIIHKHPKRLFLFPWFGLIFWYAMLISMLAWWGADGRPIWHWLYGWDMTPKQFKDQYGNVGLIYISDIGATKMQGVFISLSCTQGIVYCLTVLVWYVSDEVKIGKTKHFLKFSHHEKNLIFASLICCCIGSLGILFCSIFNTRDFHRVHLSMVGVFLAGMAISVILTGTSFILTGKNQYKRENDADDHSVGYKFWTKNYYQKMFANTWLVSGIAKLIWVIMAIVWAICFGGVNVNDISAVFEWLLAFWYGIIFVIWSFDMYIHRNLSEKNTA
ncbi:hypothetical protein HANVADRAFT_36535 [Hanseniaspora valbyensis NRRL Y-1626]|uniref:CWH43-like N-terminal domain-containing protein n=1 Tax=Hanseniaspora valbyensis NRRL Y-1626 TaxID=766949 RepID=A0A1B7TJL8_9ASCO|nr:hypothetical protein HANVADRAFT_36535 [Hanseniaspora valbyensis NRRL Y-1626]